MTAAVWLLTLSWRFSTTKCHHFLLSLWDCHLFAKGKESLRGTWYNTRDELIRAIGCSIRNINKDGRADDVRRLLKIWKKVINKGGTILRYIKVLLLWIKPCQKYWTVVITFYSILVFWAVYYRIILAAASWHKRLGARLPPLGSWVRVSVPPCGFRGGRNGVWVGFSRGFFHFSLPPISFHHFSTLISSISFHFISPCDAASGVVGRHPCYSRTYNLGASSHLIPRPDLVLDTSWGYIYFRDVLWFFLDKGSIYLEFNRTIRILVKKSLNSTWRPNLFSASIKFFLISGK